jgi:hypothetical protein
MPSIHPNFEYDIFISYRHNDNRSGWVTEFVNALQEELAATIKEPLTIYFDKNPHNGLLETHDVDDSLKEKLKSLIFIPIVSQTYCDPKSFAWKNEFLVFLKTAAEDSIGLKVRLPKGNISSRVLPVRIHELEANDKKIIETELGPLRAIDFTYQSAGVNRPLRPKEDESVRGSQNIYRDQINKTANAIKEIIAGIQGREEVIAINDSDNKSFAASIFSKSRKEKKWKFQLPGIRTLLVLCLLLIALLTAALFYTNKSSREKYLHTPIITSINLPDSLAMSFMAGPLRIGRRAVDISPDGKTIVYVSMDRTGASYLNLRPIGEENVLRLPGTKGAFSPFFSPDSKWIAFFADDKLIKISVDGNIKETIAQTANPIDGIWGTDDQIVWAGNESTSFNSIDSRGADRRLLKSAMRFFSRPIQLSSDTYIATNSVNEIYIVSFKKGVEKLILSNGSVQAIHNDELFFIKGTDLFAIGFDETKQVTVGNPHLIEKGISRDAYGNGQVSISHNGTLVYANGTHPQLGGLVWRSDKGELSNLPFKSELYGSFSLSPDNKNLATIKRGEQTEVWNYDLIDPINSVQISQQGVITNVVWAPNSNWIYYQSYKNATLTVARRDAGGRGDEEVILSNDSLRFFTDVDKNGVLLCSTIEKDGSSDLNFYSSDNSQIRYSFTSREGVNETLAKFVHEDWIGFTSDQTGRSEVFISDLLNPAVRIQVSFEGGEEPRYHATANTLYYRNGNKLMEISLTFDATRKASLGTSKIVFEDDSWVNVPGYSYDISPDGKQFLLVRATGKRETTEIKVRQNFSIK